MLWLALTRDETGIFLACWQLEKFSEQKRKFEKRPERKHVISKARWHTDYDGETLLLLLWMICNTHEKKTGLL